MSEQFLINFNFSEMKIVDLLMVNYLRVELDVILLYFLDIGQELYNIFLIFEFLKFFFVYGMGLLLLHETIKRDFD
jgi:hypothetical protein